MPKKLPSIELLNHLFYYEDGRLVRKTFIRTGVEAGMEAGRVGKKGYRAVSVQGSNFQVHRIIYRIARGPFDESLFIDHINGNRSDNRIENLRLADKSINCRNTFQNKNNHSGVTGVSFHSRDKKWNAIIGNKKKNVWLGSFGTKDEAIQARKNAERQLGYSPRHGETNYV